LLRAEALDQGFQAGLGAALLFFLLEHGELQGFVFLGGLAQLLLKLVVAVAQGLVLLQQLGYQGFQAFQGVLQHDLVPVVQRARRIKKSACRSQVRGRLPGFGTRLHQ
jgi:hypothetical protein